MHRPGSRRLAFHASAPHECSYLADRTAVTLFVDPNASLSTEGYSELVDFGFRRSGDYVYRPACPGCQACVSIRVPVADFRPNRSQRRCWVRNQDLRVTPLGPSFDDTHFRLYQRYIRHRHPGGGMDTDSPTRYLEFFLSSWAETEFYEFRSPRGLVAVAVVDRLRHGLSAVYTFFDPNEHGRSLGTFACLWEIARTRQLGLDWLYLGYWVAGCDKMDYKTRFRPYEALEGHLWTRHRS